jgi:hypothetical protein
MKNLIILQISQAESYLPLVLLTHHLSRRLRGKKKGALALGPQDRVLWEYLRFCDQKIGTSRKVQKDTDN